MDLNEALTKYKELYLFELDEYKVLFTVLPWKEYRNLTDLGNKYPALKTDIEEIVWRMAVVEHNYPAGLDYMDTGVVTTVARLIFHFSGCSFSSAESLDRANIGLVEARDKVGGLESKIKLAICEAFPSYVPEDLDHLTWGEILERLAQSEVLLKKSFEFKVTSTEQEVKDDSDSVFQMLNDYSFGNSTGTLDLEDE